MYSVINQVIHSFFHKTGYDHSVGIDLQLLSLSIQSAYDVSGLFKLIPGIYSQSPQELKGVFDVSRISLTSFS